MINGDLRMSTRRAVTAALCIGLVAGALLALVLLFVLGLLIPGAA